MRTITLEDDTVARLRGRVTEEEWRYAHEHAAEDRLMDNVVGALLEDSEDLSRPRKCDACPAVLPGYEELLEHVYMAHVPRAQLMREVRRIEAANAEELTNSRAIP